MRFTSLASLALLAAFVATCDCKFGQQGSYSAGFTESHSLVSMSGKRSSNGIYKDMLLRNIYTHSFWDSSGALKRAATCGSYSSRMFKCSIAAIRALANAFSHQSVGATQTPILVPAVPLHGLILQIAPTTLPVTSSVTPLAAQRHGSGISALTLAEAILHSSLPTVLSILRESATSMSQLNCFPCSRK